MKISISRGSAAAVALLILGLQASLAATPPQYIVDPAFNAPLFTARSFALRTFVLPDDRFFVVGGTSTAAIHRISGERRGSIFRFNPNGTLDNTFLLDAQLRDFSVTIAAPAPGNKVYVVCVPPTFLGGPDRLFRLNSDGSLDNSFDAGSGTTPNAAGLRRIRAILVDPSERVIVAGQFGDFSGHGHPNLLRLTSSGLLDQSFAAVALQGGSSGPSLSPSSHTGIALQTDGKLIISGAFSAVNGTARHQVARLHDNGTLDTGFVPAGYTTASAITSVAIQANGQVVLGGRLRTPSTSQSWRLFRLNTDGSRDNGFTLSPSGTTVRGIKFTTGGILVASTGSVLQKFGSNGALDSAFNANAPSFPEFPSLYSVDVQSDGRIIFAGTFQSINNEQYSGLARYDANGALDPSFNHAAFFDRDTLPFKVASRADGKIVVTGDFEWVNGIARFGSAVLNQDGSVGPITFPPFGIYFPGVFVPPSFLPLPNDQILFFGLNELEDNIAVSDCLRLNANGTQDSSFAFEDDAFEMNSVLRDGAGRFLLSSGFSAQSVVNRILLTRALENGTLDDSFLFGVDLVERNQDGTLSKLYSGENRALATLPGEKVLFKYFDGVNFQLLRLQSDSFPDESFNEGSAAPKGTTVTFPFVFDPYDPRGGFTVQPPNGAVEPTSLGPTCVLSLNDGRMILGGEFVSYNGLSAGGIVQLSSEGVLLSTFGSGVSFAAPPANTQREPSITALELESTGRILALGDFDRYNGTAAPGLVRIDADGTRDASFAPPLVPRSSGTTFTDTPLLARAAGGSFLLVGNYTANAGSGAATSIFRLVPVPVAVSRKSHAMRGTFDVDLPFAGAAGIEPRRPGASDAHQIVVTFPAPVTFAGAAVTGGIGSVSSSSGNGTAVVTLNLTGVADQQTISVALAGVNDGATTKDIVVRMSTLLADTNASGAVNSGDSQQTRSRSGQLTDANNFRSDVNTDGAVNSGDASVVRSRSGSGL